MKKTVIFTAVTAVCLAIGMNITAFAGTWASDAAGWWWRNDDGSYPVNTWQWIDGNADGTAECYYFDSRGYLVVNGTTPDGYTVDGNGAWVENGQVRTKTTGAAGQGSASSGYFLRDISSRGDCRLVPVRARIVSRSGSAKTATATGEEKTGSMIPMTS